MSILKVRKWAEKKLKSVMLIVLVTFTVSIFFIGGSRNLSCRKEESDVRIRPDVIAKVNGKEIHRTQFDNAYANLMRFYHANFPYQVKPVNLVDLRASVLDQLIDREIRLQGAKKERIKVKKKEIEKKINDIAKNFKSRKEFEERVYKTGQNMEMLKAAIKEDLLIEKLEKKIKGEVSVSDEEIKNKYEQVRARHILIKIPPGDKKDEKAKEEEAKRKAEKIIEEYNSGEDFAFLAKKYSEDPGSKESGGDLGFFGRDQMVPEFEKVAFSLKKGEISSPVKTSYGYHIIKVEDRKEAKGPLFEKEKKKIKKELLDIKKSKEWNRWNELARKKAKIEIYDQEIRAYKLSEEGKIDDAIKLYRGIIDKMPDYAKDSYIIYQLAKCWEKKNKTDEAIKSYKLAIKYNQEDPDIYFALGEALYRKGEKEESIRNYKKASSLVEDDLSLLYALQSAWERLGMQEEKEKESKRIAEIQERMQKEAEEKRAKAVEETKPIKVEVGGKKPAPVKVDVGKEEKRK